MVRTGLLDEPPKPRQQGHSYVTPPPSPRSAPLSAAKFKHFGLLQPVSEGPQAERAYYLRSECLENGSVNPVDYEFDFVYEHIRWTWPVRQYCNIYLDVSGNAANETTKIVALYWDVRLNGDLLERGEVRDLRHGDRVEFGSRLVGRDATNYAMSFVWLQCLKGGWLPLDYEIEDPAQDPHFWYSSGYETPPASSYRVELAEFVPA